jgi:hypothetical protein
MSSEDKKESKVVLPADEEDEYEDDDYEEPHETVWQQ